MNARKKIVGLLRFISSVSLFFTYDAQALVIGSDTAVSRQTFVRFPASGADNSVLGFAGLNGGFSLADNATSFTFNSYFSVGSSALLNGGTCYLNMDLIFDGLFELASTGTIFGNRHVIKFMERNTVLQLPRFGRMTSYIDRQSANGVVNSVAWSSDDRYLAAGTAAQLSQSELYAYLFDGSSLKLIADFDMGIKTVNQLSWQPVFDSPAYFVVGTSSGLSSMHLVPDKEILEETSSIVTVGAVNAVAWSPKGDVVVVGKADSTEEIAVYRFEDGKLNYATGANLNPNRTVQRGAIDWNTQENTIAVGTNYSSGRSDLHLFSYDGSSLSLMTSVTIGQTVSAVKWSPDGTMLALGFSSGSNKLRLYSFNPVMGTLVEMPSFRTAETQNVYGIAWSADGSMLAVARATGASSELRVFGVDIDNMRLVVAGESTVSVNANTTAMSHHGTYIALGDAKNNISIFDFLLDGSLVINNASLFFNEPVLLREPLRFQGSCVLDAGNYSVDLGNASIVLESGSSLLIKNAIIKGLKENNLYCLDNSATLSLANAKLELDDNFSFAVGRLAIVNNTVMTGAKSFNYQSAQPCFLASKANWLFDNGMILRYDPLNGMNNLITFQDASATLRLRGATFWTPPTGLQLLKGNLTLEGDCSVVNQTTTTAGGIIFGDGINPVNDTTIYMGFDCDVACNSGWLIYNNTAIDKFYRGSPSARLFCRQGAGFYVAKNCLFPECNLTFATEEPLIIVAPGVRLTHNNTLISTAYGSGYFQGYRMGDHHVLDGNKTIMFQTGESFLGILVSGSNNALRGNNIVSGPIELADENAALTMAITGFMNNDIDLNGGTLTLGSNLIFAQGHSFTTGGTVDLSLYRLSFDSRAMNVDSAISWRARDASLEIKADTTLSNVWTLSGTITIEGNGNTLLLAPDGKIVLEPNSHVIFKNIIIENIKDENFVLASSARMTLENVVWIQAGDIFFRTGALEFKNKVKIGGPGYQFAYQSTQTSMICRESELILDAQFTLSYDPVNYDSHLITLEAPSSQIVLKGGTLYAGLSGLHLTHGQLTLKNDSRLLSEKQLIADEIVDHGITFGDGIQGHDCCIVLMNYASLHFVAGSLNFRNVNPARSLSILPDSVIHLASGVTLRLYENMYLQQGTLSLESNAVLARKPGKQIIGIVHADGQFITQVI